MGKFQLAKTSKIHKYQNSELLNVLKWQFLNIEIPWNWLQVKFEPQKNPEISTLSSECPVHDHHLWWKSLPFIGVLNTACFIWKKYSCSYYVLTVWKFHDYSIDQILREINFGDSRSAKTFFLDTFKDCTFLFSNFHELLHFLKDETHQNNKIQGPKISNNGSIRISRFSKNWFHVKSEWQRNPEISL